ncbi:MAG TPA: ImuA family protein [Acetobacteraceae bacterium]|nr:ImuA family protein [Acetobacteraceae bacterium]
MATVSAHVLEDLRVRVARIEQGDRSQRGTIPFGVPAIDRHLPGGGLALGSLHEVAGGGLGAVHGAAATLFAAGILARLSGSVLWCLKDRDLFAPALAGAGLHPDRVIYAEGSDEKMVLACLEEGLRHPGLAGVIGEVSNLTMTASRRLHLAAETSGVLGLVVRRWRTAAAAVDFGQPTAAVTRWRVSALPSSPLPVPGVGRPRWMVELIRARAGQSAEWELESCNEQGRLALPAVLADRSVQAAEGGRRAAG